MEIMEFVDNLEPRVHALPRVSRSKEQIPHTLLSQGRWTCRTCASVARGSAWSDGSWALHQVLLSSSVGKAAEGHKSLAARRTKAQPHFDQGVQARNRATVAVGQGVAPLGSSNRGSRHASAPGTKPVARSQPSSSSRKTI